MKTLVNFRDAGGLTTKTGQSVKTGKIFRSGEIVNLSPEDHQLFTDHYGIKTIFDFRGESEIVERPDDQFEDVEYINLDIMKDATGSNASQKDLLEPTFSADKQMTQLYRDLILIPSSQKGYQTFLEKIASDGQPFIFHCFAGKDRTGVGAALILEILGVNQEDIFTEYLLTNKLRWEANQKILDEVAKQGGSPAQLKEIEGMLSVKKEYLAEAYATMNEHYGSPVDFVKTGLGFSEGDLADFRKLYLN